MAEIQTATHAAAPTADAAAVRQHQRYRPYFDGLRAVAVYLVLAFHAGLRGFSGGFIGVDVFFVLSGFLVTSILFRDLVSRERIDWRRFYSRRVRRILPAAVLTLLVTAGVYAAVASPSELQDALGGFRAALLYVANWFFIGQSTNYFAADLSRSPILHFWSLSVEEQFYVVWPLVLGAMYFVSRSLGRRRWWTLRVAVLALGLASTFEALHLAATNVDRAYYGTDARAYQLLAGAFLALTPQLLRFGSRYRRTFERFALVALGGLVFMGTSALDVGPIARGVFVAVLTVLLIASLENASRGTAARFLSAKPLTYLGKVSYGTYLWHWPVIVLLTRDHRVNPLALFAIACATSTALAAVSFHVIEHPLRTSPILDRFKTPIIAAGATISVLAGLVVAPAILNGGSGTVSGASASSGLTTTGERLLDWRVAKHDIPPIPDCLHHSVERCTVVKGSGPRVVLVGDSNARMWIPAFIEIAKRESWSLSIAVYPNCPWQRGLQYAAPTDDARRLCADHQQDWYTRQIPQFAPDIVFLAHVAYDDPAGTKNFIDPNGNRVTRASGRFESLVQSLSAQSLQALEHSGRKIVIIEPTPRPANNSDPLVCLSRGTPAQRCEYTANQSPTPLETYYRHLTSSNLYALNLDRVVCPRLPRCDAVVDGIIVKRDETHITATFARSRARELDALLRRRGVLPNLR